MSTDYLSLPYQGSHYEDGEMPASRGLAALGTLPPTPQWNYTFIFTPLPTWIFLDIGVLDVAAPPLGSPDTSSFKFNENRATAGPSSLLLLNRLNDIDLRAITHRLQPLFSCHTRLHDPRTVEHRQIDNQPQRLCNDQVLEL